MSRIILILFMLALPLFTAPAHAQDAGDGTSAAPDANGQGAGDDNAMPDPLQPRKNPHRSAEGQLPPVPADAPKTEKRGDDLVVHTPGGDYTEPGFLRDIPAGQVRALTVNTQDHGSCKMQVDGSGTVIAIQCEK